ncbi:MAG: PAS domain S-box protein [Rhodospirillales bacterium]|nr:PAS domain S-box protein [Rhodospirillales bacterium]
MPHHKTEIDPSGQDDAEDKYETPLTNGVPVKLIIVCVAIAAAVFVFDFMTPLGIAAGVPYVALVLAGASLPKPRHIYLLAALGTVLTIVGYVMSPDGDTQWIVLTNRGLAIFVIWITALILASRRRAKLARDEKNKELDFQKRALDEHAIVSAADVKGHILYVNDKFCTISGYSREELIGKNHRILKSSEHSPAVYEDMWQTISSGKTWHGEIKNKKKNGDYYWVQATIVPSLNEKGKPFQYVSIRTDITDRKQAEEEAAAANQAKSEFLSSMSHELRTPMNAIMGFSQMLKYTPDEPLSETQTGYVDSILQGGGYLMELINQVLELSKIETGQITLNLAGASPRDIIDGCLIMISGRADMEGIDIVDDIPSDGLPALWTDSTRLTQALLHLLSNAVKYNRKGGTVTLNAQKTPENMMRISVTDTGKGIPAEKYDDLFKPFDRLGREARNIEGSGIGLTIAKHLVDLLGGKIGFESVVDKGSTFWIDVPLNGKQVNIPEQLGKKEATR